MSKINNNRPNPRTIELLMLLVCGDVFSMRSVTFSNIFDNSKSQNRYQDRLCRGTNLGRVQLLNFRCFGQRQQNHRKTIEAELTKTILPFFQWREDPATRDLPALLPLFHSGSIAIAVASVPKYQAVRTWYPLRCTNAPRRSNLPGWHDWLVLDHSLTQHKG